MKVVYHSLAVLLFVGLATFGIALKARSVDAEQPDSTAKKEQPQDADKKEAGTEVPNAAIEALVKAANFNYSRTANGTLQIIADSGDDPLVVSGLEEVSYTTNKGDQMKVGVIVFKVLSLDAEKAAKPPLPLLMHMNETNDRVNPGKFILISGQNAGIWYESAFWLSTATADTIRAELINAYLKRKMMRKEMEPYLKDEE